MKERRQRFKSGDVVVLRRYHNLVYKDGEEVYGMNVKGGIQAIVMKPAYSDGYLQVLWDSDPTYYKVIDGKILGQNDGGYHPDDFDLFTERKRDTELAMEYYDQILSAQDLLGRSTDASE